MLLTVYEFSFYHSTVKKVDIHNFYEYLMNKNNIKITFGFIKQVFITLLSFSRLLASVTSVPNFTTFISLNDQPCMARLILLI